MAVHKLAFDDFLEDNFHLLAVHSTLELYRIGYLFNQALQTKFEKKNTLQEFDFYEYYDTKNQGLWNLIANKGQKKVLQNLPTSKTLFTKEDTILTYLLSEYKTADYLIKIEGTTYDIQKILSKINTIPQIITTFVIDTAQLKSKNNLILY